MAVYHSFSGPDPGPTAILSPHSLIWKTPAWSMTCWIKTTGDVNATGLLSTNTAGNLTTTGVCWEGISRGLFVDVNLAPTIPIADLTSGGWHPVGVTYDITDMRTYADGAPSGYVSVSGLGAMVWGTNPLTMAAFGTQSGLIALPQFFNRKLTAGEIATLATGGQVTAGLVARWPATEGSGTTIAEDVSGLHATSTGVITWSTDIPTQLAGGPPGITGRVGFDTPLIDGSLLLRGGP